MDAEKKNDIVYVDRDRLAEDLVSMRKEGREGREKAREAYKRLSNDSLLLKDRQVFFRDKFKRIVDGPFGKTEVRSKREYEDACPGTFSEDELRASEVEELGDNYIFEAGGPYELDFSGMLGRGELEGTGWTVESIIGKIMDSELFKQSKSQRGEIRRFISGDGEKAFLTAETLTLIWSLEDGEAGMKSFLRYIVRTRDYREFSRLDFRETCLDAELVHFICASMKINFNPE